jgi:hypothetical protein
MITDPTTQQFKIEATMTGIRITWIGKREGSRIAGNAITILVNLLAVGVIAYYTGPGSFGDVTTRTVTLILLTIVGMYLLYRIYDRVKDLAATLLNHEVIQVDAQGVTIERSGFLHLQRQVVYTSDKIACIRSVASGNNQSLFLVLIVGEPQIFCRGISETDATATLAKIQERLPQYRDIKP